MHRGGTCGLCRPSAPLFLFPFHFSRALISSRGFSISFPHVQSHILTSFGFVTFTFAEWQDERPPAPSYLRILYLGKILQDEDTLSSTSHSSPRTDSEPDELPPLPLPLYLFDLSVLPLPPPLRRPPDLPVHHYCPLDTTLPPRTTISDNTLPTTRVPCPAPLHPTAEWSFPITQPDPSAPPPQATVVHLSVRSVPPPAEDVPKKRRGLGARSGDEEGGVCGCCGCIIC